MLFGKKSKIYLTLITLISFTSATAMAAIPTETTKTAAAPNIPGITKPIPTSKKGTFIELNFGQKVPFTKAWCFDETAVAKILSGAEMAEKRCELKLQQALAQQEAKLKLDLSKVQLRLNTVQAENANILRIKNQEIADLEAAALKRPNEYNHWWATGGFVTGALVTVAVIFAVR